MFHTFSYDTKGRAMLISTKVWSDFGAHIPLIRSFSLGPNLTRLFQGKPIESPLFPGEPIRHHFGFYALVGMLEKLGLPIDLALNLPSALGFFLLLVMIYLLAVKLFRDKKIAALSVVFFLFNGSLSFLRFFTQHPLSTKSFFDILTNSSFQSFGPWDGGIITAFWNLNIYTNQRHLSLSYALLLGIILLILARGGLAKGAIIAFLLSVLLFINYPAAGITGLFLLWFFLVKKDSRKTIALAGLLSIPVFVFLSNIANITAQISFQPGYLVKSPLTVMSLLFFWFSNLGLHLLLIPVGIFLAPKNIQKLFGPPLFLLFLLPNLFRFSPDMINNHKFFNFFLILGTMFSAYALVRVFSIGRIGKVVGLIGVFALTFSGIIDFFPVLNDAKGAVADVRSNPDVEFFIEHTRSDAVILNSRWFYHPASLAGRTIFSGYSYFTWSYGYDKDAHEFISNDIYNALTNDLACQSLRENHIEWVEIHDAREGHIKLNAMLWHSITPSYRNQDSGYTFYDIKQICK